jgi:hypothetical protein
MPVSPSRFSQLDFAGFRALASDPLLSRHEKVGFPDSYREGKEEAIFADMCAKLPSLQRHNACVLEIGPGCSLLPVMLAQHCAERESRLMLVDSAEMLALLPDAPHVCKVEGAFPEAIGQNGLQILTGGVHTIVAYSVVQYVFNEGNLWRFFDQALSLLADGGELFLGDIPNVTMRKRFFASAAGEAAHQAFTGLTDKPQPNFNTLEPGQMDDSVVLALLARARSQGYHAWVLPQACELPMANRREDLLVRKP